MKKLFAILMASAVNVANAGFSTGVVVGSAMSGSDTTIKKYPSDTLFLGDGRETYVMCTYRDPSLCAETTRVFKGGIWETVYYTPEKYAADHGYRKILQKGLFFRADRLYHIMRVEK